jgi:diguanylate cyclase (GGDEF)-like protein/PAS domain S-box-containing protein
LGEDSYHARIPRVTAVSLLLPTVDARIETPHNTVDASMQHEELHDNVERLSSRVDQVIDDFSQLKAGREAVGNRMDGSPADVLPVEEAREESGNTAAHAAVSLPLTESLFEQLLQQIVKGQHTRPDLGLDSDEVRELLDTTPDIAVELDHDGRVLHANAAFSVAFGYLHSAVVGTSFIDLVQEGYRRPLLSHMREVAATSTVPRVATPDDIVLFRARHQDGSYLSVEALLSTYREAESTRLVVVMRDLSAHRSLLEELRESKDNYDALSETITEAIVRLDESFTIVYSNAAIKSTFGYEPEEVRGEPFRMLFPPGEYQRNENAFRKYFIVDDQDRNKLGLHNTIELLGKHKHRGIAPMEVSFGNSKEYRGRTLTCIIRDITRRKNAERRLRHLAYHDQLTGLGNRDLFNADMRDVLHNLENAGTGYAAVMFLDLDGFKQVNDTLGHEAGDNLLIETASRLKDSLRESDSVYRFGGDEFVVVLSYIRNPRDAALVANGLLAAVRRPYEIRQNSDSSSDVAVGVSIGIALTPSHGSMVEELTKAADLAMYSAKEAGKSQFAFYTSDLNAKAVEQWELEQGIRSGLERGEFGLHYQPLVDTDGRMKGVEALMRWDHPTKGAVSPGRFIPIAEETGLIVPLGNWVLETAFRDVKSWNDEGYPDLYVSINLSPRQFEQKDLVDMVGRAIERTGANPRNVKIEITETCIMSAPEEAMDKMRLLKERHPGLTIAIDDFGTGYSSLSYLSNLPADIIKIDLSFVVNLFAKGNQKIVNAIIGLAHSLGLEVVAEGVESSEQWDYFRTHECQTLQGFHFNRPVPQGDIGALLKKGLLGPPSEAVLPDVEAAEVNDEAPAAGAGHVDAPAADKRPLPE